MEITITADIVAWYAASIATLALILQFTQVLRERINVVVVCKERILVGDIVEPYKKDTVYLTIIVRNKGRYRVTIQSAGFMTSKSDKSMIFVDSLNFRPVDGGESTTYLVEKELVDLKRIKRAFAIDAAGRKYTSKSLKSKFQQSA